MIHVTDPAIPNLDIVGIMAADQCFFNYRDLSCPCESCEGILIEAWERMTGAGVGARIHAPTHRIHDRLPLCSYSGAWTVSLPVESCVTRR